MGFKICLAITTPLHIEVGYVVGQLTRVNTALSDAVDMGLLGVSIESVESVCDAGIEVILTPLAAVRNGGGGCNRLRTIAAEEHFVGELNHRRGTPIRF
jgi:hypothetical protein